MVRIFFMLLGLLGIAAAVAYQGQFSNAEKPVMSVDFLLLNDNLEGVEPVRLVIPSKYLDHGYGKGILDSEKSSSQEQIQTGLVRTTAILLGISLPNFEASSELEADSQNNSPVMKLSLVKEFSTSRSRELFAGDNYAATGDVQYGLEVYARQVSTLTFTHYFSDGGDNPLNAIIIICDDTGQYKNSSCRMRFNSSDNMLVEWEGVPRSELANWSIIRDRSKVLIDSFVR